MNAKCVWNYICIQIVHVDKIRMEENYDGTSIQIDCVQAFTPLKFNTIEIRFCIGLFANFDVDAIFENVLIVISIRTIHVVLCVCVCVSLSHSLTERASERNIEKRTVI